MATLLSSMPNAWATIWQRPGVRLPPPTINTALGAVSLMLRMPWAIRSARSRTVVSIRWVSSSRLTA